MTALALVALVALAVLVALFGYRAIYDYWDASTCAMCGRPLSLDELQAPDGLELCDVCRERMEEKRDDSLQVH